MIVLHSPQEVFYSNFHERPYKKSIANGKIIDTIVGNIPCNAKNRHMQVCNYTFSITNRGIVTIQSCLRNYTFQSRVYFDFDKKLKYCELKKVIRPVKGLEYKGAGIRCHGSFIGMIMKFFKLATKVNVDGKVFYLNNKSLCKYVIRKCETLKILKNFQESDRVSKFEEVVLRMNDLFLRSYGSHKSDPQIKTIMDVLKATVRTGHVKDTDRFEELITTLQEVAEKTEDV